MALSLCGRLKESFVTLVHSSSPTPSSPPLRGDQKLPIKFIPKKRLIATSNILNEQETFVFKKEGPENISSIHTESKPIISNNSHKQLGVRSTTLWIHLQASISTEWEHKSILMNPTTKIGARVITHHPSSSFQSPRKTVMNTGNFHDMHRDEGDNDSSVNPKTVHRCILKCGDKSKQNKTFDLECHVCHWKYSNYNKYFHHLIELQCSRQKPVFSLKRSSPESSTSPPAQTICQKKRRLHQLPQEPLLVKEKAEAEAEEEAEAERHEDYHLQIELEKQEGRLQDREVVHYQDHRSEEAPLNLTSKKKSCLLKEGSQDPVLGSSIVDHREYILRDNKEAVRKLTGKLQKTIVFCPETIDDSIYCPHWASRYLPALSVNDNVNDEILLSELRAQITKLLLLVFGEEKLTVELGYPVKDVFEILDTASCVYGRIANVHTEREACRNECNGRSEEKSSYFVTQLKYRLLKRKINITKKNLLKFIESLPHFYDMS